jgi:hypothetical protein
LQANSCIIRDLTIAAVAVIDSAESGYTLAWTVTVIGTAGALKVFDGIAIGL